MTDRDPGPEDHDGPDRPASAPWAQPDSPPPAVNPPPPPPPGYAPPPPPPPGYGPPGYGPPGSVRPPLPKGGSTRTGPLPLHPMTVGDILDGAFKLLKANAVTILTIVAVFVVPIQVVSAFLQRNTFGGASIFDAIRDPSLAEAADAGQTTVEALAMVGAFVVSILVLPFLAGAISHVVAASYLGTEVSAGQALIVTLRRGWALFASWVVVHVLEVLGFLVAILFGVLVIAGGSVIGGVLVMVLVGLVLGVPGLLVVMALSVAVAPAIVVEELGPIQGVRRSWALVRRRFWPVLGIALLAGLIASVIGQVLATVPTIPAFFVDLRWGWILLAVGGILASLVTEPIVAIVATLIYFDARIRTEGFDLQVIAAELAARGGAGPAR